MSGSSRRQAIKALAGLSAYGALGTLPGKVAAAEAADTTAPYKDPRRPLPERVKDLMSRMTLEEKVAQIIALWATKKDVLAEGTSDFSRERAAKAHPHGFGQVTRPSDRKGAPDIPGTRWRTPADTIRFVNDVQRWAVNETRLGIPVLFHEECLHGYMAAESTMFPMAIAMAGSFDPALVRRVNEVIAREVRAHGSHLVLSPVVDIARDPRWGRIEETFGEDPYLCGEMGVASVLGLQGEGRTLGPGHVFATLKHMTGHGEPQSGENVGPAFIPERELRDSFLPPFRAVVARTGISSVMPSYNEIDGVPSHVNRWLLGTVLRGEWRFDGAIVSDYFAVEQLATLHHVAHGDDDAAIHALETGVDCELPDGAAYRALPTLVRAGRVPESAVDAACARMLSLKFRAGLFEQPYADPALAARITGNDEARALALEAARRSLCLLANDGTLPLNPGVHKRVAVIGPNAAVARLGGYSGKPRHAVSLLDGVKARLANKAEVVFAQGMRITQSEEREADDVRLGDPVRNRALIAEAVEVARGADVILLAIGDTEQTSREAYAGNHLGDRTSLDLVGDQNALFDALHALGKPLVVLAINGRPPSYPNVAAKANALLECWYPGQEGGTAMAEAIFGDVNPGAKLPVTVARDVSQVSLYYYEHPTPRIDPLPGLPPNASVGGDDAPLFPFGYGLSYTTFELGAPRLSASRVRAGEGIVVEVDVRNTGSRAGDEVVQVYVHDRLASVVRPVKRLWGFARVSLAAGEARTVRIALDAKAFALWDAAMKETIEPGMFDILAGPNSRDLKASALEVAGMNPGRREAARRLLAAGLAGLVPGCASTGAPDAGAGDAGESLDAIARRKGLRYGNAIGIAGSGSRAKSRFHDERYRALMARECGVLVCENETKWQHLRPRPDVFRFGEADEMFAWAREHGMLVRGHTLMWQPSKWLPKWVNEHDFGARPAQEAERLLVEHVGTVCRHFGTTVSSYDVVNEAVDPKTGELRANVFTERLGAIEELDLMFRLAREYAPHAQLVYNDYMSWGDGYTLHRAGVLALLREFRRRGTPVQALGLQSHIGATEDGSEAESRAGYERDWRAFLDEVTAMGYDLLVTEFDVNDRELPGDIPTRDAAVASLGRRYLDLVLSYPRVRTLMTWGMVDPTSWLQDRYPRPDGLPQRPNPYDGEFRAKALRSAIADAMRAMPARAA